MRGGEEEEGGKQGAAERQEAKGAGTSQGIQVRGLSQEKDDNDGLPDESPAKRKSKSKKEKAADQGSSASKAAPWVTEAKEAGEAAAGVGVEAKSWPSPLQADVEQAPSLMMSGAAATCEGEKLFMAKFNLWPSDTSSGEVPTTGSSTALGPAAVPEEAPAPAESMSRAAPAAGLRFTYQFQKRPTTSRSGGRRRVWVSLSRSAGGGDACCCKKARARRFARRRRRVPVYCRSDAYRSGGAVASPPRQHRAADGIEQRRHGALLGLRLDGGRQLAGPSGVQRQRCLVPLTSNERILVLSDVARGLAYLHSEVRVIHRDVKSANVLLYRGCHVWPCWGLWHR